MSALNVAQDQMVAKQELRRVIREAADCLVLALCNTDYDLRLAVEDVIGELREAL